MGLALKSKKKKKKKSKKNPNRVKCQWQDRLGGMASSLARHRNAGVQTFFIATRVWQYFGNISGQGLARAGLWKKSSPLLLFVNKVLLEPSHTHSFTYCLWLFMSYKGGKGS